jgi:hypothetical protein
MSSALYENFAKEKCLSDPRNAKPLFCTFQESELSIPGPEMAELLGTVLKKGKRFRFKAKGFSMSPFIRDGDLLTLSCYSSRLPRTADIVAFVQPDIGKLIIHRIVGRRGEFFMVKGDNHSGRYENVLKGSILGYVQAIEKGSKKRYLGLGLERFLIAWLSRNNFLPVFLAVARRISSVSKKAIR